ncbi:7238_t:CDS:1, partial [Cetraspora pellucida]
NPFTTSTMSRPFDEAQEPVDGLSCNKVQELIDELSCDENQEPTNMACLDEFDNGELSPVEDDNDSEFPKCTR